MDHQHFSVVKKKGATEVTDAFLHIHQTQLLWCCDDQGRIDAGLSNRGMMKRLMTNIMMMTNVNDGWRE